MMKIWLFVILAAFVSAWVAFSSCSPQPRHSENAPRELHAVAALSTISFRQREFFARWHRFGSLHDLTASRGLDASYVPTYDHVVLRRDYYIRVEVAESDVVWPIGMWCAYAWPVAHRGAYRTFVIWENSSIYATSDGYEGASGPALDAGFPANTDGRQPESYLGRDGRKWVHVG